MPPSSPQHADTSRPAHPKLTFRLATALAVLTLLVFWQTHSFGFIVYDDPAYGFSHLLDVSLIGAAPGGHHATDSQGNPILTAQDKLTIRDVFVHHLTNILFHALNAWLLLAVLSKMQMIQGERWGRPTACQ